MEVYYIKDGMRIYGTAVDFGKDHVVLCMQDGSFQSVKLEDVKTTASTARNTNP